MKNILGQVQAELERCEVSFELLSANDREQVVNHWLRIYAQKVKQETGAWVHNRFKWHGFSYGYETALAGEGALKAYQNQWAAPFVIFDEEETWGLSCEAETYPDFSPLGKDLYVAHHNMKWTMIFTHEQPDDGPYFAENKR